MTEEQYRSSTLTFQEVKFQLDKHSVTDHSEFFNEIGHAAPFTGTEVLDWLGY